MIRKLWRRLFPRTGDIYVVWIPFSRTGIIGASTKLQGAEYIRTDHARLMATNKLTGETDETFYRHIYDQIEVTNIELLDGDTQ